MDRVDLEADVIRIVDQVQFRGYGLRHDVEDPALLRELIRLEAHGRSLRVCTGVAMGDERTVWACRPRQDIDFLKPTTAEDARLAVERMQRAMGL